METSKRCEQWEAAPKQPMFSRTSVGKNRWFWVVKNDYLEDPVASGVSCSPELARAEVEARFGRVKQVAATTANHHWRKQRAVARQQSASARDEAQPLVFAYRCYRDWSDYDGSEYEVIEPHRVVKKSKQRIYVEQDRYEPDRPRSGEWWDYDRPTFVLDRREFESNGKAERRSRGWWEHSTYYADPSIFRAERNRADRPACFEVLGLPAAASVAEVKSAYRRLSRTTHPDAGGTDSDFVRLVSQYEEALRIAAGRR